MLSACLNFPLDTHTHAHTQGFQFYSQNDIRHLVKFASDRGVRVIPELDSPGHFNTEHCYPDLLTVADYPCPGAGPGTGTFLGPPDPSKPALWSFFTAVYAETAALFPDSYVSLGGDEAWLTPWGCSPGVEQWMATNNFTQSDAARYYEQRLFSIVDAQHKRTMMWAPGEAPVSNSTVRMVWTGWPQNGPRDGWKADFQQFTAAGSAVVLSGPWYLTPSHPEWDAWADWYHTDPTNFTGASAVDLDLVLGGMGTIWSDIVKEDIMTQAWPLMNAVAEQLWSSTTVTSFPGVPTARYTAQCARLQQRGILNASGCVPPPPPPPPLPPPPPPAPVHCSPHTGVKLNNTEYADGNGPRTTADAEGCCHLCGQTDGCAHWSFQVDTSVPGKVCHWATLTYCCWLHASDRNPVPDPAWVSDVGTAR
jgi:N-acetyl-beta-hexosaminidase